VCLALFKLDIYTTSDTWTSAYETATTKTESISSLPKKIQMNVPRPAPLFFIHQFFKKIKTNVALPNIID
jgi:hypothetical protein